MTRIPTTNCKCLNMTRNLGGTCGDLGDALARLLAATKRKILMKKLKVIFHMSAVCLLFRKLFIAFSFIVCLYFVSFLFTFRQLLFAFLSAVCLHFCLYFVSFLFIFCQLFVHI